ncbi:hypothetical protein [Undibacterium rugosum]|uniref:hypothetical protein n=1 Tax=Undibacterium rugosum TaxID=2762291 RepID=UPI001B8161BA|nr:hypothetical protein [Undibacterium rugosum]MBR7780222.1 hypothetical protein [Undibacterium rugosum]
MIAQQCCAFGVDKLKLDLDASKGFKKVEQITIFNDTSDEEIFVTAKSFSWAMDVKNALLLGPTSDIEIFPSMQKIPARGTATFKVRYSGAELKGEKTYRLRFDQISVPKALSTDPSDTSLKSVVEGKSVVGMAITVPVYVVDFSQKSDAAEKVSAMMKSEASGELTVHVDNVGDRHVEIAAVRIDGVTQKSSLGVVLAKSTRIFPLSTAKVKKVELNVTCGDSSQWVVVSKG